MNSTSVGPNVVHRLISNVAVGSHASAATMPVALDAIARRMRGTQLDPRSFVGAMIAAVCSRPVEIHKADI
jgi:hypothetical protein